MFTFISGNTTSPNILVDGSSDITKVKIILCSILFFIVIVTIAGNIIVLVGMVHNCVTILIKMNIHMLN